MVQPITSKDTRTDFHRIVRQAFGGQLDTQALDVQDGVEGVRIAIKWAGRGRDSRGRGRGAPGIYGDVSASAILLDTDTLSLQAETPDVFRPTSTSLSKRRTVIPKTLSRSLHVLFRSPSKTYQSLEPRISAVSPHNGFLSREGKHIRSRVSGKR